MYACFRIDIVQLVCTHTKMLSVAMQHVWLHKTYHMQRLITTLTTYSGIVYDLAEYTDNMTTYTDTKHCIIIMKPQGLCVLINVPCPL